METSSRRRVHRNVPRRRKSLNAIVPTLGIAILLATLFTSLSPTSFLPYRFLTNWLCC